MRTGSITLAVSLVAVVLCAAGCEAFLTHRGGEGEPCFSNPPYCAAGLECNPDGLCVEGQSGCQQDQDCDDQISCTRDSCVAGNCQHQPDDAACVDDQFCNGTEVCDPEAGCRSPGNPCPGGGTCDEAADNCPDSPCGNGTLDDGEDCDWAQPRGDHCCDHATCKWLEAGKPDPDGYCQTLEECRVSVCDGQGHCTLASVPDGTACGDQTTNACSDPDTCQGGVCQSNHLGAGEACQQDECTSGGQCDGQGACQGAAPLTNDTPCAGDGLFCTGSASCQEGVCTETGRACSVGTCDEAAKNCCQLPSGNLVENSQVTVGSGETSYYLGLLARDFNADGILDLALLRRTEGQVTVLLGNGSAGHGDGSFGVGGDYAAGESPADMAAGDFNSDGITDLAIASSTNNFLYVALGGGTNGKGNGKFLGTSERLAGMQQSGIVAADFDADGILDLAVACNDQQGSGQVAVLIGGGSDGRGDGSFTSPDTYATGPLNDIVTADFTGDGILDLAVADGPGNQVIVFPGLGLGGHGNGSFDQANKKITTGVDGNPIDLAAGDIDNDGITDLAAAAYDGDKVYVLLGNGQNGRGDGTFTQAGNIATGSGSKPRQVLLADFDADGNLDLAIADSNESTDRVLVALGNGDGTFATPTDLTSSDGPRALAAGDFDEDGDLDLAVAHWVSYDVRIFLGGNPGSRADFSFTVRQDDNPGSGCSASGALALADINKDGALDVATLAHCEPGARIGLLRGETAADRATGYFAPQEPLPVANGANGEVLTGLVVADLNNDSLPDLAATSILADPNLQVSKATGADGQPDGIFSNIDFETGTAPRGLLAGDLDADGFVDLVALSDNDDDELVVFINDGNGDFGSYSTYAPCDGSDDIAGATLGDFTGNSITDAAVLCRSVDGTAVLRVVPGSGSDGRGSGGFNTAATASSINLAGCSRPGFVAAGDLDNDNILDLAVACTGADRIDIMRGGGANGRADGSFSFTGSLASDPGPVHLAVADLDGDGNLDLAAVTDSGDDHESHLNVFRGRGDGTFAARLDYPAPAGAAWVASGRVNADSVPDLVVASTVAGQVSVYFGGGVCYP